MISRSHRLTTTAATPLPIRFVMARYSLMNRSIPTSSAGNAYQARSKRPEQRVWKQVQDETQNAQVMRFLRVSLADAGIQRERVDVKTRAGLEHIDHRQHDDKASVETFSTTTRSQDKNGR